MSGMKATWIELIRSGNVPATCRKFPDVARFDRGTIVTSAHAVTFATGRLLKYEARATRRQAARSRQPDARSVPWESRPPRARRPRRGRPCEDCPIFLAAR